MDRNYYCDHDTDWIRAVALRKESVDRNIILMKEFNRTPVALRKESVDRNWSFVALKGRAKRRSPQGERG